MDMRIKSAEELFLDDVRRFLDAELTPELRDAGRCTVDTYSDIAAAREWHRRLHARGWVTPIWPVEHGGAGWTARQRLIFEHECARRDAPILFAGGIRTIGPLLIAAGSPEQQARYLPAIRSGADLWCQGFSETQAGSDLAALQLRAVRDGSDYVLNGHKIWTTGAHDANRMFALVRTEQRPRRQDGITFLLIDMDAPGITVRPIHSMSGDHEVNQVFFEDVRVPVDRRVGEEHEGWTVAKLLMRFARASNTTSGLVRRAMSAAQRNLARAGGAVEPALRQRMAGLEIELDSLESLELRLLGGGGEVGESVSSLLKLVATELHQRVTEASLEAAGLTALPAGDKNASGALSARKYFNTRAASIYSGTNETHRNVLAATLLGKF